MTPLQIVLLVVGILGFQALLWIPLVLWARGRTEKLKTQISGELASRGEKPVRGPCSTLYRGGTGEFPMVKGNGVIALTEQRVIFRKMIGKGFEVQRSQIVSVREARWFAKAGTGGRKQLIFKLQSGDEVAWMFAAHEQALWLEALGAQAPSAVQQ